MKKPTITTPRIMFRLACLTVIASLWATHYAVGQSTESNSDTEEIVKLSPFTVNSETDEGYRATETLAGTRIRTNVRDIGSALSVVTSQFLEDTAARDSQELLVYTVGTEVGGLGGNFTGTGDGAVLTERNSIAVPNSVTRVRGLDAADNTRDLFLTDIPWDSYAVDRMEIQRGPNSILFGLGKPGGVINASMKQARFNDLNRVEARVGSYGTVRGALDVNRVLLDDQLAVRLNVLSDHTKYQQDPAFKDDARVFAALRYDPSFLNQGSVQTTLRVGYEHGDITSNRPRTMPPTDRLTPWFESGTVNVGGRDYNNLNQFTEDFRYRVRYFADVPGSGSGVSSSPNYQPASANTVNGIYGFYPDLDSGQPGGSYYMPRTSMTWDRGLAPDGSIDGNIGGLFGTARLSQVATTTEWANAVGLPFAFAYKNKTLTDPSIYNFYEKLLDGPNKHEQLTFDALNVTLSQSYWDGRVGFELAYDYQDYQQWNDALHFGIGRGDTAITVDINEVLPDGSPNPNVGRPTINSRTWNGGTGSFSEREVLNLTGYAELRAEDFMEDSWLSKLFGRHVFTGAASRNDYRRTLENYTYAALVSNGWDTPANRELVRAREFSTFTYLGPDMRGASSASGLNLSNIPAATQFPDNTIVLFDSNWNRPTNPSLAGYVDPAAPWDNPFSAQASTQSENPANYVGWTTVPTTTYTQDAGDRRHLTQRGFRNRDKIESEYFVWQGYLWDDLIVPTFGYRKDTAQAYSSTAPRNNYDVAVLDADSYELPTTPDNTVSGSTKTYSLVVHSPDFIKENMPWGLDLSLFYNKSSNFAPAAGRIDIFGDSLENPGGETEDYGVTVSALNDRLFLKVNKFETVAQNTTYSPAGSFWLLQIENLAWSRAKRYEAGLSGDPMYAGEEYNYGTFVNGAFVQTAADRSLQQQHVNAVLNAFDGRLWDAWGAQANDARWQSPSYVNNPPIPSGTTSTVDTVSSGYEFELNYMPVPNWNIALNAARVKAVRDNVGGAVLNDWIEARNAIWNGAGGELRTSGTGTQTHAELWNTNFYGTYQLDRLLEGSNAPEVRRWRYNLITNYRFTEGRLNGVNIGGSYRWEDKVAIGYPGIHVEVAGQQLESFDISDPFYGPAEDTVDLWVGYARRLWDRFDWKIQLNVRNALGENKLIPINVQPDGGPAAFRIKDGPSWSLTNTFEF